MKENPANEIKHTEWKFLMEKGQKSNISALKEYVYDLIQMTTQKTAGQRKVNGHINWDELDMTIMSIVIEATALVLPGDLDKKEANKDMNASTNASWIPVEERLPEKNEYFADTSSDREFPNGYYRRLEIAYTTDTVEYTHGYYDGYKWMDKWNDIIKNVVAWKIHDPYRPERSEE